MKSWLIVAAGVACLILGIIVVGWHPSNEIDLVAGGVIASGVSLLALVFP